MADSDDFRIISRDLEDDRRVIVVVKTGGDGPEVSDDEIIDKMLERSRDQQLHAVDDE
ncbi:hypothetical protein [Streptomyces aurantiogriseus]|uniref:Uncharacterized protein n=1 Tax=Streptomyces aurantiogriseus TaxID=66870 RepID=A0A918FNV0_9ACTN|nr:hypothetical protein [Streptomyces aurantiogriseus]GGR61260.1 hypothetical protein GCM10010251_92520 [Streptomyces aurantiogriseus]